jgi:heme/copper-type cytochrome/quinol oxidase subunit 3
MSNQAAVTASYHYKLGINRMGLWLFLASDLFLFGGLYITRWYLLGGHRPELNQMLGLIVTSVLLVSSFFMNRAETSIAHGDRTGFLSAQPSHWYWASRSSRAWWVSNGALLPSGRATGRKAQSFIC